MSTRLTCGLCGTGTGTGTGQGIGLDSQWTSYYRAVYCIGLDSHEPQLSGLAFHLEQETNCLPPEAHQRFDDSNLGPLSLITIRGFSPPGPDLPGSEKEIYAWGFSFHDSCWQLVEQACAPTQVDLKRLWRILRSVPHTSHLLLWGHNFGGLYLGSRRDDRDASRFVVLGGSSNLIIPSAYHDPFKVPELKTRLAQLRIRTDDTIPINEKSQALTYSSATYVDPFSILPVELRDIILTYIATEDILYFRLSSRVIATTPLSQHFFQSRFWPGRELDFFFDAFLLRPSDKAGVDWRGLYRFSKKRIKYNLVGLGERNRLRIWKQTVRPLTQAIDEITRLSELKGKSEWSQNSEGAPWKSIESFQSLDPELFGELNRHLFQVEIELPSSNITAIHVSFAGFFGSKFISGMAFETEHGEDIEIGYIMPGSEEPLLVETSLEGFHLAIDYCGFRAISPYAGQHMESEYLDWVGNTDDLPLQTLRCSVGMVRRIRATFDSFWMYLKVGRLHTCCELVPTGSWREALADHIIVGLKELPEGEYEHHIYMYQVRVDGKQYSPASLAEVEHLDLEFLQDPSTGRRVAAFGYSASFSGSALALKMAANPAGEAQATNALTDIKRPRGRTPRPDIYLVIVIEALGRCGRGAVDMS
ncbi:hypothetical protein E0Z10_g10961 [Xylaria hypoxylon]|uniref:DUF7600 domain-containing protein n=1 Tax=Xylaria hypoxylon TaxID=37992 RepID=A0A4Z0XZ37_9PEZI|nr:hypothetical protein E0Z10_g10961 [Xylaria hypoxylon]